MRGLGLTLDTPAVLAEGANVVVQLAPSPVVAKVAATTHLVRTPRPWLGRELRRLHATAWYALYTDPLPLHRARAAGLLAGRA